MISGINIKEAEAIMPVDEKKQHIVKGVTRVSIECHLVKPDWCALRSELEVRWLLIRDRTICSSNLEMNGRSDKGNQWERISFHLFLSSNGCLLKELEIV